MNFLLPLRYLDVDHKTVSDPFDLPFPEITRDMVTARSSLAKPSIPIQVCIYKSLMATTKYPHTSGRDPSISPQLTDTPGVWFESCSAGW